MNRLKLDFSLNTIEERTNFVQSYLLQDSFLKYPPTPDELEMIGNYILWGKELDGTSPVQKKEIEIKTRSGTWDRRQEESLDALIENPTFNEQTVHPLSYKAPTKIPKRTFNRAEALRESAFSPLLQNTFMTLFRNIDELDLLLNFYDLKTGKRITNPRAELLAQFTSEEIEKIKERAQKLNGYNYLKRRHELVELRRQQYTLRDSYAFTILQENPSIDVPSDPVEFAADIDVLPLSIKDTSPVQSRIFTSFDSLMSDAISHSMLRAISDLYWRLKTPSKSYFDFREQEHVYQLILHYNELFAAERLNDIHGAARYLKDTFNYYVREANLDGAQSDILKMKIKQVSNADIARTINKTYNKSYTVNYISTIFRQKIIVKINNAAKLHEKIVSNLWFPEAYKECTYCGRSLLIDSEFFVRKSRSKDGFNSRCKKCDKEIRQQKKKAKEELRFR